MNRHATPSRDWMRVLLALTLCVLPLRAATAQRVAVDPRWAAWVGCWTASGERVTTDAAWTTGRHVCVVPALGLSAADIVTIDDGRLLSREHLDVTGTEVPFTTDGCAGWQSARWSVDGRRIYYSGDALCPAARRTWNGMHALSQSGDWLDIVRFVAMDDVRMRVSRFKLGAGLSGALPEDVRASLAALAPAATRRREADSELTLEAVVETAQAVEPDVTRMWLREHGQALPVDAKALRALDRGHVPGGVIDVMVALAYPKAFAVRPRAVARSIDPGGTVEGLIADCASVQAMRLGSGAWRVCDAFAGNLYLANRYMSLGDARQYCLSLGSAAYAASGCGIIGGDLTNLLAAVGNAWYYGQDTVEVVAIGGGGGATSAPHGRVVKGQGYTQSPDAPSTPASGGSSVPAESAPPSAPATSGASAPSPPPAPAPTEERTAHPR